MLFDLDGTVANTIPLILASYAQATMSVLGTPVSEAESRLWIGETLAHTFNTRFPEHSEKLVAAYLSWNAANMDQLVQRYENLEELIIYLKREGVVLGVVTSKRRSSAEQTLAAVGLTALLPLVGCMEDTAQHKPSPDPLLRAVELLGRRPDECVYVGDTPFDLQAAKAAGMAAIGVTWGAGSREELDAEGGTATVGTIDELRRELLSPTAS